MERVHKPHNLAAILRSSDAVGVLDVHAVPVDAGLELSRDTSGGTRKWIRVHQHPTVAEAVDALKQQGFSIVAAHPVEGATDYRSVDYTAPTAFLMGTELHGVSDLAVALADRMVVIPMMGMTPSLNVSVATALLLYEAYRQREAAGLYATPRLPDGARARLLFEWGYPKLARRLRDAGVPYPDLGPEGTILDRSVVERFAI